jgi:hypothetical protein
MRRIGELVGQPDRLAGIALLFVGGVAIREGAPLPEGIMGPGFAPLVAGGFLAALAASLLLWPDPGSPATPGPTPAGEHVPGGRAAWTFLALGLYVLLLRSLGFTVTSAVFLAGLFRLLGRYPLWGVLPAAAVSAALLSVIFRWGLQFPLPAGPWGF